MKLSVLIPTYDYKCYTLVENLQQQLEDCSKSIENLEYEIFVLDDGGKDQVISIANLRINELPHCRFEKSAQNVGRANNRNKLISKATGDWCLIIDSDAKVVKQDYIATYIAAIENDSKADIFVGDLVNPPSLPSPDVTLRYFYEKAAEPMRLASVRQQHATSRFSTFNVLIRRSALLEVPFDKDCTEYGWEDALMGVEMGEHGKQIRHIDNPLMHMGFDTNACYLKKVETGLRSLKKLGNRMLPHTSLGQYIDKLQKKHLLWAAILVYRISKPLLRRNLLSEKPNLKVFAFYKLGYFLSL